MSIQQKFAPLFRQQEGSIAVMAALILTALLMFTALSVDLGLAFFEKRRLQAATDAAAMAAAQHPGNANAIATQLLTANGFGTAQIVSLTTGSYTNSSTVAAADRYTPNGTPTNAVKLSTSWNSPLYFARSMSSKDSMAIGVSAAAASINEAGLVAGSGLVSVNQGLVNAVLGAMLGSNITLTAVQYQGLVNTQINAIDFLNALATQVNLSGGTYSQLLSSTVSMKSIVAAEIAALNSEGQVGSAQASALQGLGILNTEVSGTANIALGTLINAGIWQTAPVGSIDRNVALDSNLNLFQLDTFGAQIANGSNMIAANNALSIPGVATINVQMTGIEPQQGSYFTLGPVGTTVHTSQVRLLLTANLLSSLQLGASSAPVSLPVYVEVANGTATVTGISCGSNPASDTVVNVSAQSGVANAYVGSVTPALMTNFSQPVTVGPATIVNALNLVTVKGSAQVPINGNVTNLSFSQSQIDAGTAQTVTSTNMLTNLGQGLASNLQLQVNLVGLPISTNTVATSLNTLLSPVFAGLDSVLDSTLRTLGVRVGYLDVTVTGARCGVPALIQ